MIRAIVGSSLRFRRLVVAAAAGMVILGIVQLPSASIDVLPEISPPYVEIQTEALGLSAEEVEQLITVPLEADLLNGVAWLDSIESTSVTGLSSIVLTFEMGTDPIRARQMVSERLTQAHAIPNVSKPPVMLQPLSSSNRLMMVSLSSEELSLIDMSVLARWTIRPRLMGVQGVANVAIWGQRERQLQVLANPERLQQAGVSLDDVIETTGNALWVSPLTFLEASTPGTGGFIDTPNQRLAVQHRLPIHSAEDLGRVTIETPDGTAGVVRLSDVADVVEDHQPLIGDAFVDDASGLLLVIEKFPEANTLEVTAAVDDALAAMAPGLSGLQFDSTVFRPANFVESAVGSVALATLIGLVLVAVVVAGLMFDWRAAVISLISIATSIVVGGLVLVALGATINAMTVAGFVVAVAVLVDDAIAGTTDLMRRLRNDRQDGTQSSRTSIILQAITDVRGSMVYATLVLLIAMAPALLLGDVIGALLPSLILAYVVALLISTAVSLTVTPALAVTLLGTQSVERREPRLMLWLRSAYGALLARLFDRPRPAFLGAGIVSVAVVVLFGASMVPALGRAEVPQFEERDLLIQWDGPPGTSHTEMSRIIAQAGSELRGLDGVRSVGAQVGRAITSDQVSGINAGEIWLSIAAEADYAATLASVEEVVAGYPGLSRSVTTYSASRATKIAATTSDDLVVRVFGNDLELMRSKAEELRGRIAGIDGVESASVEAQIDEPSVLIEVDLEAAARVGLKPGDIRRAAATLLSGIEVGSLFESQKVFEVVVWGAPELRTSVTSIQQLPIETPDGGLVELADVADVTIAAVPTAIRRDQVQRAIDIGATVTGRDLGSVLADVEAVVATTEFPLESHAEVLELTENREALQAALLAVGAAALIGIFLLLQAAFASWRLALLVTATLPAGLSGAVVAAFAIGHPGSIAAIAGLLAVLAVAIRQPVLLMDHYRHLLRTTTEKFGVGLALRGARERLPSTLATTLATAAALVPILVLGARAGLEIIHPATVVILGGLVTSTLVNLFLVPSLFLRSGMSEESETAHIPIEQAAEPQVIGAG